MTQAQLLEEKKNRILLKPYEMRFFKGFNYSILKNISVVRKRGRGHVDERYNDVIIFADTETSKSAPNAVKKVRKKTKENGKPIIKEIEKIEPVTNYVVAWTITIRAYHQNIVTLYGHKPSDMTYCLHLIQSNLPAERTFVFFHNLSYDWVFERKFLIERFGEPVKQLSTKPHFPVEIAFENGIILKDTLILCQRSLDKWAKDLNVDTKKAIGKWDYDKIRTQYDDFTSDELEYIEHDTVAGAECVDKFLQLLNKELPAIPYTATGIPREQVRLRGRPHKAHAAFKKQAPNYELQQELEALFHGGYVHGNRHWLNYVITVIVKCFDFSSSYPFVMLSEKFPCEKFMQIENCSISDILSKSETHAFVFKLVLIRPRLKDYNNPMPALQFSKCVQVVNPILDNGRILEAEYAEIYLNDVDLTVISAQYDYDKHICSEVYAARKDYLPRWLTDYIFELYTAKTNLKPDKNGNGDSVLYVLKKGELNSIYGLHVQRPLRDELKEDYATGDFNATVYSEEELRERYTKYCNSRNTVTPYQIGVYVTSYAFRNLFILGSCAGTWLYSDTDSCYGYDWDMDKINAYNESCKAKLKANGYGCVFYNDREYWLGLAELDSEYSEFIYQGAKRYCGRSTKDGELHITVAGVPKKAGAACLKNDINNFRAGFVFKGSDTGKKTHSYIFTDKITIDSNGNEIGDSIDLTPCDYELDSVKELYSFDEMTTEEVGITAII